MSGTKRCSAVPSITCTVRDLWVTICIGECQQMSVLLKKWHKSDGYFCLDRAMHIDCIGMRAISIRRIARHNVGWAIRRSRANSDQGTTRPRYKNDQFFACLGLGIGLWLGLGLELG